MAKASVEIKYHVEVDRRKVDKLVKEWGETLVAAVDAQIATGRPPQAVVIIDTIRLFASSKANAREQGVRSTADYLIFGMPADCDLARESDKAIVDHPDTVFFPLP